MAEQILIVACGVLLVDVCKNLAAKFIDSFRK